jgi:hypothetical protein
MRVLVLEDRPERAEGLPPGAAGPGRVDKPDSLWYYHTILAEGDKMLLLAILAATALTGNSATDLIEVGDQLRQVSPPPTLNFIERHWGVREKPSALEWSGLLLVEGLIVVDVLQTNDCLYHREECSEGNALIGRKPSRLKLWGLAGVGMLATGATFYYLPSKLRWVELALVGTVEAALCAKGLAIGMRLRL